MVHIIFHYNIAAIIALPLVAIIAGNIFNIAQPYTKASAMYIHNELNQMQARQVPPIIHNSI